MTALFRVGLPLIAFLAVALQSASAATLLPLSSVARAYGFVYVTEGGEVSAHLSRPGVSILVRAGDPRYQINDDTAYERVAPVYQNNQIYVDAALEPVLARLAEIHPWPSGSAVPPVASTLPDPSSGSPMTIAAEYVDTTSTIAASGIGPAGAPVDVVIKALISREIPAVTIARTTAYAAADGTYRAVLSVLSLSFPDVVLELTASSGPHVKPATTLIKLGPPSPKLVSPNDTVPNN